MNLSLICALWLFQGALEVLPGHYYRLGDDPSWAEPHADLAGWTYLENSRPLPSTAHSGVLWIRYEYRSKDPLAATTMMGLSLWQVGATDVYFNGRLIHQLGKVGSTRAEEQSVSPVHQATPFLAGEPLGQDAEGRWRYVVIARHSHWILDEQIYQGWPVTLRLNMNTWPIVRDQVQTLVNGRITLLRFVFGACLALGLLHLFLFLFYRDEKLNFYFALGALTWSAIAYLEPYSRIVEQVAYFRVSWLLTLTMPVLVVTFVHSVIWGRPQKTAWLFLGFSVIAAVWHWESPFKGNGSLMWIFVGVVLEMIRSLAFRPSTPASMHSWVLISGATPLIGLCGYQALAHFVGWQILQISFFHGAILFLLVSMSIYIAQRTACTQRSLKIQLEEIARLSDLSIRQEVERIRLLAENDHKSAQLEAARTLQLSMLPRKWPALPGINLAAAMTTAAEVGGDYYDWRVAEDGTLTVAVGDATGHGLEASIFVASFKALFNALSCGPDLPRFMSETSKALKLMKQRKMFLALAMVRYQTGVLRVVTAGIPSPLLFRARTGEVVSLGFKAPPLASMTSFTYPEQEHPIEAGDTLLMITDGVTERFNPKKELFGEPRLLDAFRDAATTKDTSQAVLDQLMDGIATWAEGHPLDDDMTLLVIRWSTPSLS